MQGGKSRFDSCGVSVATPNHLLPKETSLQKFLKAAAPIDDQHYVNLAVQDSIEDAVGFEKDLPEIADAQGQQFLGVYSPAWGFGQTVEGLGDLGDNVVGFSRRIVLGDVVVQIFQVVLGILGEQNDRSHLFLPFLARSLSMTSSAG